MTPRKLRLLVARAKAAAVDHDAVEVGGADVAGELDGAAGGADALVQLRQHAARLDMALGREEQRVAEAALQRRLELGKAGRIEPAVAFGHPRKALEIVALARVGDDERAVEGRVRQLAPPDVQGALAEPADDGFGDLRLAPGREHAAGPMAGGIGHRGVTALV